MNSLLPDMFVPLCRQAKERCEVADDYDYECQSEGFFWLSVFMPSLLSSINPFTIFAGWFFNIILTVITLSVHLKNFREKTHLDFPPFSLYTELAPVHYNRGTVLFLRASRRARNAWRSLLYLVCTDHEATNLLHYNKLRGFSQCSFKQNWPNKWNPV